MRTLWPQNRKFYTFFTYISSTSTPFQKHFTSLYRATLVLHFMFWLLRCTLWLERIMSPNLKFPLCLSIIANPHIFLNYCPNKTCDTLLQSAWHELHFVLLHISHIKSHSGSGSRFVLNFSFFLNLSILHVEACIIPLRKAVFKGLISFSYT